MFKLTTIQPSFSKVNALRVPSLANGSVPLNLVSGRLRTRGVLVKPQLRDYVHASTVHLVEMPNKPEMAVSSVFADTKSTVEAGMKLDMFGRPIEREYRTSTADFHVSLQKLTMLAKQISGLDINLAILQMQFSQKKASKKIMHNLVTARHNAKLQLGFDPERMYISQARVGKGKYIKNQLDIKAKGRFGLKEHPYCHMKFLFKERALNPPPTIFGMNERRKIKGFRITRKVWTPHNETRPIYNPKPHYNW